MLPFPRIAGSDKVQWGFIDAVSGACRLMSVAGHGSNGPMSTLFRFEDGHTIQWSFGAERNDPRRCQMLVAVAIAFGTNGRQVIWGWSQLPELPS
jgi:hypothetical protein